MSPPNSVMALAGQYALPKVRPMAKGQGGKQENKGNSSCSSFQMPLHYPRYSRADYQKMPEWQLDCLLKQYGLPVMGDVDYKRKFAMGAFLWPTQ